MHYVSHALVQSAKGRTRTHDIAGQPPDPQHVMQIQIKFAICAISYLTGGKPSSKNGSHAHGGKFKARILYDRNLCSWSSSFCFMDW